MRDVTRDVTRDVRGESRAPYRSDPNLSGPLALTTRVETEHHGVGLRTARVLDAMMTLRAIEVASDILDALDFDPAIPCACWDDGEGPQCDRVADMVVKDSACPTCGHLGVELWPCADECWAEMWSIGCACNSCGQKLRRDDALSVAWRLR